MLTKENLIKKRDEYLRISEQYKNNSLANEGAAQAIGSLISDLEKIEKEEETKNNEKVN